MRRVTRQIPGTTLQKIVFLLLVILFLASSAWQRQQQTHLLFVHPNAPTDGYGVYESCEPSQGSSCLQRLKQIASGGFKLVLNYDSVAGSASQLLAYASQAQAVGVKLIWAINAPRFWNGTTDLRHYYFALATTCHCSNNIDFLRYLIDLVKNNPATWGYYIGDEVEAHDHAQLKSFSDLVHQFDPHHPRLFIACATCSTASNAGHRFVGSLLPMVDTADVVGADYYPVGSDSSSIINTSDAAESIQRVADSSHKGSVLVLQAFSFTQYNASHECAPYPNCATFPTYEQMLTMKELALSASHPRLILWYSYYNLMSYDHASQHWSDLVKAINAK